MNRRNLKMPGLAAAALAGFVATSGASAYTILREYKNAVRTANGKPIHLDPLSGETTVAGVETNN